MFVGLGLTMMLLATYGLFAWQLSLGRIGTLCVAGILLMAAQFLRVQRTTGSLAEGKGSQVEGPKEKEARWPLKKPRSVSTRPAPAPSPQVTTAALNAKP